MFLWTATELKTGGVVGLVWGIMDWLLGGIDAPVLSLAVLMVVDFVTGVAVAYRGRMLSSRIGSHGVMKKVGILLCIVVAVMLDNVMGTMFFRGMVITGFAIIEAMSLVENVDKLGYGDIIPDFLRVHLARIASEKHIKEDK